MKRIIAIFTIFLGTSVGTLAEGLNITLGATGSLGLFDAAGKETMTGTHQYKRNNSDGDENTVADTKTTSKTEDDMFMAYGAVMVELGADAIPGLRIGLEYVPYNMESEITENKRNDKIAGTEQGSESAKTDTGTSKVSVDLENYMTAYLSYHLPTEIGSVFIRGGIITADLITQENLVTGSQYGNASLDGTLIGAGIEYGLDDGMFIRGEVNQTSFDNIKLTNTGSENNNTIDVTNLSGNSVALTIGKTF